MKYVLKFVLIMQNCKTEEKDNCHDVMRIAMEQRQEPKKYITYNEQQKTWIHKSVCLTFQCKQNLWIRTHRVSAVDLHESNNLCATRHWYSKLPSTLLLYTDQKAFKMFSEYTVA